MPTVRELAALVGGEVCGEGGCVITAARPFGEATETDITFLDQLQTPPETSTGCSTPGGPCR